MGCLRLDILEQDYKSCEQKMFAVKNNLTLIKSEKKERSKYLYGMNTQEKDDEIFEGAMGARYWEYDSRIGKRWNMDPIWYEWQSPYACFNNNPVYFADPLGLYGKGPKKSYTDKNGKTYELSGGNKRKGYTYKLKEEKSSDSDSGKEKSTKSSTNNLVRTDEHIVRGTNLTDGIASTSTQRTAQVELDVFGPSNVKNTLIPSNTLRNAITAKVEITGIRYLGQDVAGSGIQYRIEFISIDGTSIIRNLNTADPSQRELRFGYPIKGGPLFDMRGGKIKITVTRAAMPYSSDFDDCWNLGIRYKITTERKNP